MATTHAELVTPERVLFSGEAEFVVLRSEGGEIMFLPHHAPFVGAVDITVVRIAPGHDEGLGGASGSSPEPGSGPAPDEVRAAVHGGFVHVADNRVLVLASVAELADEIDVERARRALEEAEAAAERDEGVPGGAEQPAPAGEASGGAGGDGGEGGAGVEVEQSPTMRALLYPDDPEVAARRARARLEAAGVLEAAGSGSGAAAGGSAGATSGH